MIGKKIKYYRKQASLTLQEISARTGLSIGYLSNLERDLTSPSFDNLCSICNALSVNVVDLIKNSLSYKPLLKKADRTPVYARDYRTRYEFTTAQDLNLLGMCLILEEDYYGIEVSWGHDTDEYGLIMEGSLIFEVNGEKYLVEEGDTIYIKAGMPHKWRKAGEGRCVSYWTKLNYIISMPSKELKDTRFLNGDTDRPQQK